MWQNLGSRAGFNGFWLHFGAGETPCTSYKNYKLLIIYKYYFNVIKKKLKFLIYCQVCHKTKYKVTKKQRKIGSLAPTPRQLRRRRSRKNSVKVALQFLSLLFSSSLSILSSFFFPKLSKNPIFFKDGIS